MIHRARSTGVLCVVISLIPIGAAQAQQRRGAQHHVGVVLDGPSAFNDSDLTVA